MTSLRNVICPQNQGKQNGICKDGHTPYPRWRRADVKLQTRCHASTVSFQSRTCACTLLARIKGHSQSNTSSSESQLVNSGFLRRVPINSLWASEDVEHFCNANASAVVYITPRVINIYLLLSSYAYICVRIIYSQFPSVHRLRLFKKENRISGVPRLNCVC